MFLLALIATIVTARADEAPARPRQLEAVYEYFNATTNLTTPVLGVRRTPKKGVTMKEDCHGGDVAALGASWWMSWQTHPPCGAAGEHVPMIWGRQHVGLVHSLPGGSGWLMGFNEPNRGDQANMSPQEAAHHWPQLESTGRRLVSPAMAMSNTAIQWMREFLNACSGCRVDAIAIHLYEANHGGVQYWVNQYKQFGKPIWITEIAFPGGVQHAAEEAHAIVNIFERDPQVHRYAWFKNRGDRGALAGSSLIDYNGRHTQVGQAYAES